jgi:hypothetical protein
VNLTRRLVKSGESGEHGCPAVYATDDPQVVVVQGVRLAAATSAQLQQVAPNEIAVAIPIEMLRRAAAATASAGEAGGDIVRS